MRRWHCCYNDLHHHRSHHHLLSTCSVPGSEPRTISSVLAATWQSGYYFAQFAHYFSSPQHGSHLLIPTLRASLIIDLAAGAIWHKAER